MITLPLVVGLIVVAAAAVSVTVADGRAVALALLIALALSPFAASPLPGTLEIAGRVVAALLAAYVLWIVMKSGAVRSEGSAIGVLAELGVAAAAYVVGWWIQPVTPLQGPVAEQAAGFSLVALAALPLAGANVFRAGVGVMLLVLGASLVMETWLGPAPALAQLAVTALLLVIPAAVAVLVDVEDPVSKVVPAIEKVRAEAIEESAIGAGYRSSIAGEGSAALGPEAEAARAAAPAFLTTRRRPGRIAVSASTDEPERPEPPAIEETAAASTEARSTQARSPQATSPRAASKSSIRLFGRRAAVRGAVDPAESEERPAAERRPRVAPDDAATDRARPADGPAAPSDNAAGSDSSSAGEDADASAGRGLRNPRFKRPLR